MELNQFRDVDLVIDRANDSFVQKQFVSQGDYKGRSLTVQVTDNGVVGEVAGLTLNLQWHNKASGLSDLSAFTVIDKASSVFRIEYPEHMMTPGEVIANIQVLQDGKSTFLKSFTLTVQQLAGQTVGITQKAEFSALVAVLADSNKFRTDIDDLAIKKVDKTDLQTVEKSISDSLVDLIAQIATKVTRNENESITKAMLAKSLLEELQGGSIEVNVNTSMIEDKAVTLPKLGFGKTSTTRTSNLVDLQNVVWGKIVKYQDGTLINNSLFAYIRIPVDPTKKYILRGTSEQGCFKNASGTWIQGHQYAPQTVFSPPTGATELWQTFSIARAEEMFIGFSTTNKANSYVLAEEAIGDSSIKMTKTKFMPMMYEMNLFDKSKTVKDSYVRSVNGNVVSQAGYQASELIEIDPRYKWEITGTAEQWALYDSFGVYTSGKEWASQLKTTSLPETTRFIRISLKDGQEDSVVLRPYQIAKDYWFDEDIANHIAFLAGIQGVSEILKVEKDGSGDFTTIREAIENHKDGAIIKIGKGTWNVADEYTEAEMKPNTFKGWSTRKVLTVIGSGRENTILKCELPGTLTAAERSSISVWHSFNDLTLKNMTLLNINGRYALHDDESTVPSVSVENCLLHNKATAYYSQAVGGGTSSAGTYTYKNCTFKTDYTGKTSIPFSYHSRADQTEPATLIIENCSFEHNSYFDLRLGALASGQKNICYIIGNRLTNVYVKEEILNSGVPLDFVVSGYGNKAPLVINILTGANNVETIETELTDSFTFKKWALADLQ